MADANLVLSKRKLSPYFLLALLVILAFISFRIVGVFLNYVLTALFIAYISHPLFDWLEAKVKLTPLAGLMMVAMVTALLLVPLGFIIIELIGELRGIITTLDADTLEQRFRGITDQLLVLLGQEPLEQDTGPSLFDIVVPSVTAWVSRFASSLLSVLAEAFIGMFVMLYILYYAYTDGHRFVDGIRDILPLQEAHRDLLMHEVGNVIQAVMYGHVLTALIQAVLGSVGFIIFGVPNVVFWGGIMFLLALLPIVGPPLIWGPWGIYLILQGETFMGVGLLIYSAIMVSSLDNIIRPKLIGDRAHVHPTVVLLGVLGGVVVFGFTGLILGPLVLSIFVSILEVYRKEFAMRMEDDGMHVS